MMNRQLDLSLQERSMYKKPKTILILLAYNAHKTLRGFYKSLPLNLFDEIILFDYASRDKTYEISKSLGIKTYRNKVNLGYGGNLKKALSISLLREAEIVVDIHPDNEYKPDAIKPALKLINKGSDLVLGNRFYDLNYVFNKSGMFIWKIIPLLTLNIISRLLLKTNISDLHQGFRVYTKKLLEKINFESNSNNYLFSFELICQAVFADAKISEVPVNTNYLGKKRGAKLVSSINYSLGTFKIMLLFILAKLGIKTRIFKQPRTKLFGRLSNILKE